MADEIWTSDAGNYEFNGLKKTNITKFVVETKAVSEFLKGEGFNNKHFVIGVKGTGKTHLLSMKSKLMRENKSLKILPSGRRLLSHLGGINIDFTNNYNLRYISISDWELIWKISITYWLIKKFNADVDEEIKTIFNKASNIGAITQIILEHQVNISKLNLLFSKGVYSQIDDLPNCCCFLDNLDQAFSVQQGEGGDEIKDLKVWIDAQAGLLFACVALMNEYKHLKIYASIRAECFHSIENDLIEQIKEQIVFLRYSKPDLKKIISSRLERTKLLYDNISDLQNFSRIQFEHQIKHITVVHPETGYRLTENLFEYIYRHTFGKPREIINTYSKILYHDTLLDDDIIRQLVNEKSYDHFIQLKREVVNEFNELGFDLFCQEIKSNVISLKEAKEISEKLAKKDHINIFKYLFNIGLIGRVSGKGNNKYFQEFNFPCELMLTEQPIGHYKYYVIHPSVYEYIRENLRDIHNENFLSTQYIVGNGLEFEIDLNQKSKSLHVHFGLDRTSTSIIIPEIVNVKPLMVIIDEYELGHDIVNFKEFILTVNSEKNKVTSKFSIYNSGDIPTKFNQIYQDWVSSKNILLIIQDEISDISRFLDLARTISFSDSGEEYLDTFKNVTEKSNAGNVYLISKHFSTINFSKVKDELSKIIKDKSSSKLNLSIGLGEAFLKDKKINIDENKGVYSYEVNIDQRALRLLKNGNNIITNSKTVTRHKYQRDINFFEHIHKRLNEGLYQYSKIIRSSILSEELGSVFIDIQSNSSIDSFDLSSIKKTYRTDSKSECLSRITKFGKSIRDRLKKIPKKELSVDDSEIENFKELDIFPNEVYFGESLPKIWKKYNKEYIFQFKKSLKYKLFSKELKKIFISYETHDLEIALDLYWSLKLLGFDCWIFEIDKKLMVLRQELDKQIEEREIFIFIASKYSIYSNSCHREISKVRKKRSNNRNLICFKKDEEIFSFTATSMDMDEKDPESNINEFRNKCKNNIEAMKTATIQSITTDYETLIELFLINDENIM